MYILTTDGSLTTYPYSVALLKRDNPNTSFPKNISDAELADWGVFPVEQTDQPAYDTLNEYIEESTPVFIDGSWIQQWLVLQATQEEVAERTESEAFSVRSRRDDLLAETDWTQLPDSPVDASVWTTYRQQLRDVPAQPGFPWDVQWPEI
tara:strand:- start:1815 stop:2264 length:450 start_codon:yes stop_codon:yes gene_type:complete